MGTRVLYIAPKLVRKAADPLWPYLYRLQIVIEVLFSIIANHMLWAVAYL